jgi:hypothetical protein
MKNIGGYSLNMRQLCPTLPKKPLSIYSNSKLSEMAIQKAQTDPNLPSGCNWNKSTLTNQLLYEYLECPSREEILGFLSHEETLECNAPEEALWHPSQEDILKWETDISEEQLAEEDDYSVLEIPVANKHLSKIKVTR